MGAESVVKVFRFDPVVDREPRYDRFAVPLRDGTVLDVLNYIRENLDPSLAFRSGCLKGVCGGCPVMVNGKAALACQRRAEPEMTIAPHPSFPVIRDLVVDLYARDSPGKMETRTTVGSSLSANPSTGTGR